MPSNELKSSPELGYKPEQILKGAMQVFLQHGYAGTSMDRVAAEAKVSKHTIYSHFQGKEGLFLAMFERLVLRHFKMALVGELLDADPSDPCDCQLSLSESPEALLRRIAEIFLARMDDPEYIAFVRVLFAESGRFPELAQMYVREVIAPGHVILGRYLADHPDVNVPDPEMAARTFFGSIFSFIVCQEVLHGQAIDPAAGDRLVDDLIRMILGDRSAETPAPRPHH